MQPNLLRNRCFLPTKNKKISNVLSNTFFIDIAHVSIAIHIVIVLSPSPTKDYPISWENVKILWGGDFVRVQTIRSVQSVQKKKKKSTSRSTRAIPLNLTNQWGLYESLLISYELESATDSPVSMLQLCFECPEFNTASWTFPWSHPPVSLPLNFFISPLPFQEKRKKDAIKFVSISHSFVNI